MQRLTCPFPGFEPLVFSVKKFRFLKMLWEVLFSFLKIYVRVLKFLSLGWGLAICFLQIWIQINYIPIHNTSFVFPYSFHIVHPNSRPSFFLIISWVFIGLTTVGVKMWVDYVIYIYFMAEGINKKDDRPTKRSLLLTKLTNLFS